MQLASGIHLAHYRLVEKIGAGGMGEVWRAIDTTLGRDVAVKILPEAVASNPERRARFEREAKLLASLNHPNIATIHGHHETGGVAFLAMEFVPGEDLAERLTQGPLPVAEAIEVAREIAAALASAHDNGVIHRDLKPANVKRTAGGSVKVLDFGLAKAAAADPGASLTGSTPTFVPTMTTAGTLAGAILGTASYMSPEQARGLPVDRRADLWAFGCMLFEMLTGRRAFDGQTVTDVLAAVVTREPDWSALPKDTPASVRRLLRRCLEKDPRRRIRDAGDAALMLDDSENRLEADLAADIPARRPPVWRAALPWGLAIAAAAGLAGTWMLRSPTPGAAASGMVHLSARLPATHRLHIESNLDEHNILAISPDGSTIVFDAGESGDAPQLFLRRLADGVTVPIPGTENATNPFFSPNGLWVGFFARGKLKKVALAGGQPIELCDVGLPRGGAWGPDGTIVFAPTTTSGLLRISAEGGTPVELTVPDSQANERTHRWPAFLPGGREVLFTVGTADKPGSYEDSRIDAVSLDDGTRRTLLSGASIARPLPSGDLLLGRLEQILRLELEPGAVPNARNAVPVLDGVAGIPTSGVVFFDVAANGTLVYVDADPLAHEFDLGWIGRDGSIEPLPLPARQYHVPAVSPDGSRIAVGIGFARGGASDVWIHDVPRGTFSRLTLDGRSTAPVWSPDGRRVAFGTVHPDGGDAIAWKAIDGSGDIDYLARFEDSIARQPVGFSPDGRFLLFQEDGGVGRSVDQLVLSVADGTIRPLAQTDAIEMHPAVSPDGRWLAYVSDETGTPGIFAQAFPGPGGRWQISESGYVPRWSRDGRELYFEDEGKMYVVPVQTGPSFTFGTPRELFEMRTFNLSDTLSNYDVAPDGRFVAILPKGDGATSSYLNVVLGFAEGLTKE